MKLSMQCCGQALRPEYKDPNNSSLQLYSCARCGNGAELRLKLALESFQEALR